MKYHLFALAVALAMAAVPAVTALDVSTPDIRSEDDVARGVDQWIVGFYAMPDIQAGDLYMGEKVVSVTPELAFITVHSMQPALLEAKVRLDENVRYFESDVNTHQLSYTPNDYFVNHASNWGMNKMGLTVAWDRTLGSTSVKDVHLDSGLNSAHEEWASTTRDIAGKNFYKTSSTSTADESGCSWHGTHTAGTVAAPINNGKGFPGTAQIIVQPAKIFGGGACFAGSTTNLANAIKYAGDQGGHLSGNSWGGGAYSQAIHDAIMYSVNKGVIFFAAAGNSGCSNCIGAPWESVEASVIIVTATDSNDAGASFNSKGWESDVSAPGVYIGSSTSGTTGYHIMDGTSMATPYALGVGALIKTLNPGFTRADVENRLKSTAVDLGAAGEDDTFGAGRVNAAAAVY